MLLRFTDARDRDDDSSLGVMLALLRAQAGFPSQLPLELAPQLAPELACERPLARHPATEPCVGDSETGQGHASGRRG